MTELDAPRTTLTWGQVARRPVWIIALIAVLAVASGFAWLGKWQLERAVINAQVIDHKTEQVVPLESLALPANTLTDAAAGHMVSVTGFLRRDTLLVLDGRYNDQNAGFWVIGAANTEAGVLPVALGWTATHDEATAVVERMQSEIVIQSLTPMVGRFMPSEAPVEPSSRQDPQTMTRMAVAQLINVWPALDQPTYFGYLVSSDAPAGTTPIVSTPPISDTSLNWLNVFYGAEWLVFAAMAFYLWYRLVKDAKQREEDAAALSAD